MFHASPSKFSIHNNFVLPTLTDMLVVVERINTYCELPGFSFLSEPFSLNLLDCKKNVNIKINKMFDLNPLTVKQYF